MDRRAALKVLATAGVTAPALGCVRRPTAVGQANPDSTKRDQVMSTQHEKKPASPDRMPTIFLAHGSPLLLADRPWQSQLNMWASQLPRPKAVLMLSAHWLDKPVTLGATKPVPLVYDFYGFPEEFYKTEYPAPGAPALADRVRALLGPGQTVDDPTRGLDHGAYVPLVAMYPGADVPVLQASLPTLEPAELLKLGQKLAPLCDEGVLIVGSGFLTHNLRRMSFDPNAPTPQWAAEFDAWTAE